MGAAGGSFRTGLGGVSSFDDGPLVKVEGIPRPTGRAPVNRDICYRLQIPLGARGTTETLLKMKDMAIEASQDGGFVQMSRGVVASCGPRDYACEGAAIYDHVGDVTTYRSDPAYAEWVQSPGWLYFVEEGGASDCDCQATLISAMDASIGRACRYGAYMLDREMASRGEYSHVLCEFALPGPSGITWAGQDTVARKGFGWTPPAAEWFGAPNYVEVLSP